MSLKNVQLYTPESLGSAAWGIVRTIGSTLSLEQRFADERSRQNNNEPYVYVLWHGRMFMPMICYRNTGVTIIVSEHRDGEIVTHTLESAGFRTVRGSTTRGGVKALARLVKLARSGSRIAFTADGPRGPRWKLQPGAVFVAAKTGVPVVPITGSAGRARYFRSWDGFQLPMPFSRAVLLCGEPYTVDGGTEPENIEFHRTEIERRLTELTLEADSIVGAKDER